MAVMTSQMPSPLDGPSDSISTSSVRNWRLKSLVANPSSTSRTKSLPPGIQRNALPSNIATRTPAQPLPSVPADTTSRLQAHSTVLTRPKSTSVSVASSVRPSPRFHVANPTEFPSSPTPNQAPVTKTLESNRPLPPPLHSPGSESTAGRTSTPSSPPGINITSLLGQSLPPPTSSPSHSNSPALGPTHTTRLFPSATSLTSQYMPKANLPIGPTQPLPAPVSLSDASIRNERTIPSPSSSAKGVVRPLPLPPLPRVPEASSTRSRSSSRGPLSQVRSRTNSAVGRADAGSQAQLSFDPTSSSYVIKTASEMNGQLSSPLFVTTSGAESTKSSKQSRNARLHTHNRSLSAQTKNISSLISPDASDAQNTSAVTSDGGSTTRKAKQLIRSAPCSDTEEDFSPQPKPSKTRPTRRRLVLHNPSSSTSIHSAPTSDTEDSPTFELTSSPLLLPPTGSIKDMLPKAPIFPRPINPPSLPSHDVLSDPLSFLRPTFKPTQSASFRVTSPLPSLPEDIGYADAGFVDDERVYLDDGFDGPGGLGAFSTSVDPDVDQDIGAMVFNSRPPSGEFMGPSVMDLDMDARGRHVSRPTLAPRWKSADPRTVMDADLQRHGSGKSGKHSKRSDTKKSQSGSRGSRSASQAVIMSSLKAHVHVRPIQELELGPGPIDMELEPEMVFSKNPRSVTPLQSSGPGVLDVEERRYVRGKWRSPSPTSTSPPRNPAASRFAPVRARGFYEDW